MVKKINIHEAKTNLSRLLKQVANGEEIIIAKSGKPVAKLISVVEPPKKRKPGSAKGKISIDSSFYEDLPADIIEEFEK